MSHDILLHCYAYAQAQEVSDEAKESDQESMVEVASEHSWGEQVTETKPGR